MGQKTIKIVTIQIYEYTDNSANVSHVSETEYLKQKIDELLPSNGLEKFTDKMWEELNKENKYLSAEFITGFDTAMDYADQYINHIKSKLTEKGE